MPLTNDAQMYDIQVRVMSSGGVLYRDILEPNLPGVVWIQSVVRFWGGWSSEALRVFDLFMFSVVLVLVNLWFRRVEWTTTGRIWLLVVLSCFYFSQSEWCHCQRDVWLLVPIMGALTLRRVATLWQQSQTKIAIPYILGMSFCEGLCWGCGVWLKPHIVVPAIMVWVTSCFISRPGKRMLADLSGLLVGGMLIGIIGIAWMIQNDCWLAFLETVQTWNPQYLTAGRDHWTLPRFLGLTWRLSPWILLHVPAVVIAVKAMRKSISGQFKDAEQCNLALLSACYLGWMVQVFLLQHLFDYIHAPVVLMAILITATPIYRTFSERWCRTMVMGFVSLAVLASPLASVQRVKVWSSCLNSRSNAKLYDQLAVLDNPQWEDLARVEDFLRHQEPKQQEVCCYHSDLVSLYNRLGLLPPARYVYVQELTVFFPERRREILNEIQKSKHRFIVTDIVSARLTEKQVEHLLSANYQSSLHRPTSKRRLYPWGFPIVFRSGNYLVHRIPAD